MSFEVFLTNVDSAAAETYVQLVQVFVLGAPYTINTSSSKIRFEIACLQRADKFTRIPFIVLLHAATASLTFLKVLSYAPTCTPVGQRGVS